MDFLIYFWGFGGPGLVPLDPARNSLQNPGINAPRALTAAPFMAQHVLLNHILNPLLNPILNPI